MSQPIVSEISSNLLFRYRVNCARHQGNSKEAVEIPASKKLPVFSTIDGVKPFAEVRAAWSEDGLYFWAKVKGKKQSIWCRNTQLLESDGLQIWLDTRNTNNVHRATKFCHWFMVLPAGGGSDQKQPVATMLKINRAKEDSPTINQMPIKVSSTVQKSGYTLAAFIPALTINGWNPVDHRLMGFNYGMVDRELGFQSLGVGVELPVAEDPSLWSTLALTD